MISGTNEGNERMMDFDREVLAEVMGIFTNRNIQGRTSEILLAMNDVIDLVQRREADAYTRGVADVENERGITESRDDVIETQDGDVAITFSPQDDDTQPIVIISTDIPRFFGGPEPFIGTDPSGYNWDKRN